MQKSTTTELLPVVVVVSPSNEGTSQRVHRHFYTDEFEKQSCQVTTKSLAGISAAPILTKNCQTRKMQIKKLKFNMLEWKLRQVLNFKKFAFARGYNSPFQGENFDIFQG